MQTRSFLYIDECNEAVIRLMGSEFSGPINIGSEEMVTINELAQMAIKLSGKDTKINNLGGNEFKVKYGFNCPTGVRGRNSDNKLFSNKMGWVVSEPLIKGLETTFQWVDEQVKKAK